MIYAPPIRSGLVQGVQLQYSKPLPTTDHAEPIRRGSKTRIDDRKFDIINILGQGSYGSVFEAHHEGEMYALKEIFVGPHFPLQNARYEVEVQREISKLCVSHVPQYIGHQEVTLSNLQRTVRLIMQKIPGVP